MIEADDMTWMVKVAAYPHGLAVCSVGSMSQAMPMTTAPTAANSASFAAGVTQRGIDRGKAIPVDPYRLTVICMVASPSLGSYEDNLGEPEVDTRKYFA